LAVVCDVYIRYYQASLSSSFQAIGDIFTGLTAAVGAADKVFELMNRQPLMSTGGELTPATLEGEVEFRDVSFAYTSRPDVQVLRGLSLSIPKGQVAALVGPSGGGKSSLIKLVERFYEPHGGSILLDGRPLAEYGHAWLRRRIALVGQEPVLYARSVRRNIIFGLEADDELDDMEVQRLRAKAKEGDSSGWWGRLQSSRDTQYLAPNATLTAPFAIDLKDVQPATLTGERAATTKSCGLFRKWVGERKTGGAPTGVHHSRLPGVSLSFFALVAKMVQRSRQATIR